MYERLKMDNRNPICCIATIYDHLCLNGYELNDKLIYLACLKSFFLNGIEEIKGIPLFFIAPVENRVDLFFFEKLGFEIENIDLNTELKNKGAQNIIAYFDYYTLLSKDERKKKYNICPIHTTLIIEKDNEGWILNEIEFEGKERRFSSRTSEKLINANKMELYPYPVDGVAYRILPNLSTKEVEKRTISLIDENLKSIVKDVEEYRGTMWDGKYNVFYGLQAYDELIRFFKFLQQEYTNKVSVIQNRRYGIMLMTFRRFLLPLSGKGDFFRSEMAEAFEYYAKYKKNRRYDMVSKKLLDSAIEWRKLGNIIINISMKKDKLSELVNIIEIIEKIKKIELEAIYELKEAI